MNRPALAFLALLITVLLLAPASFAQQASHAENDYAAAEPASPAEPLTVIRRQVNERGVTVATLSNQLTVILAENHTVPVVCAQTFIRAGGLYEGQWLGMGLSHLLEHLVAKGAVHDGAIEESLPSETRDRLDDIGGQSNAYTTLDHTSYYINVTSAHAEQAVALLADWMARPGITREDFQREHGVVQRELEMGRDDANRQLYYAHSANFYGDHPAAVPVIGYMDALRSATYEDVLAYHQRRYGPQNMTLVIVGDFDTPSMLQHVCNVFAGFHTRTAPPDVLPEVPPVAGVRRLVVTNPSVQDVAQMMSFRTIPLVHDDLYALDVLSYILTEGQSSRLHRIVLRDKQLVTSVASGSWTPQWGAGQFLIRFRAEPDTADAAEAEILDQLRHIARDGVLEDELARAKRQKISDYVYGQQSVQSQAATLGSDYLSTFDVNFSRAYTDRIQSVTAEQVRLAAEKYFNFDAVVVTRMVNQDEQSASAARLAREDQSEKFTLPNGLTVVLGPTDTVDLVSMNLAVLGGVLAETPQTNGLGQLMTQLSLKGAAGRSAEQIADFFDSAGGSISALNGNNTFLYSATVLKDDWAGALEIFSDVVLRPTFPQRELDIYRPTLLAAVKRIDEQWSSQLQDVYRKSFYVDSPYSLRTIGSADVIAAAAPEDIAAHHNRHTRAGSAVLSIYGNFDPAAVRQAVELHFADMPPGATDLPTPAPRTVHPAGERYVLPTQNEVAAIMIGWPGMRIQDEDDRFAIMVLDTIISGYAMPRGWLHNQLRGAELVYVVHAVNFAGVAPGSFFVYAATQPEKAQQVVEIIRQNIDRTLTYDFTPEQINEAVNIILTSDLLDNQTMSALSTQAALDELYGFGYDYQKSLEQRLRTVTPRRLRLVAEKYLSAPAVEVITTPRPDLLETPESLQP